VEKPEGKKLQSISYRFVSLVPERDINLFAAGGIPMLRIRKMLSFIILQPCIRRTSPVIVKGTADQEVPVVTATVLLIILV
jgi:hypothetical protein